MKRFVPVNLLAGALLFLAGCATGSYTTAALPQQSADSGYCHKRLQPIGPTDAARTNQSGSGDFIDYYGPCSGPSTADQIQQQKRFEQFRFGRDYMDEG